MWLGWGILSLAGSIGWRWYAERTCWQGDTDRYQGLKYLYKRKPGKFYDKLLIGVDIPKDINCAFRKENWFDRVFKASRLTKEHQTGHRAFDERVFFISDNAAVQALVSHNPRIAESVLKIMDCDPHGAGFVAMRCRNARLWVEYKLKGELRAEKAIFGMASLSVHALHAIAREFIRNTPKNQRPWRDRHYWIAAFFSILTSGLFVNGVAQFMLSSGMDSRLLSTADIQTHARGIAIFGTGALVSLTAVFLGRTSRAHMTLLEVLLAGGIGLYTTSYTALKNINVELDTATESVHSEVISRRTEKARRSSHRFYYVNIRATQKTPEMWIEVSEPFYSTASYGTPVQLELHPGKLGYPWVSDLRKRAFD